MAAPKSEILMSPLFGFVADEKDVGRLDVAVGDADALREIERARAFEDDFDDALDRQQFLLVQQYGSSSVPPARTP
jgi:hypothetical protein